jgi:dTDP-glucose pyrophosphorylase
MTNFDERWRKALLPLSATLKDAIRSLNESSTKIVMVVNAAGKFEGTVSDGDIRRGMLKGLNLNSPIKLVTNLNAFVVPPSFNRDLVIQLMQGNKLQQVPIVDDQQNVVGLHLWDSFTTPLNRKNPMIIMAGGKGTRLLPFTEKCPKPMVLVSGKPMLQLIIENGVREGFKHFVLAINYLGGMIEEYFGDGSRFQVEIQYIREEIALGTVGALGLISPYPDVPFIVTNGDVITDIRYGELLDFHVRHNALGTMAVRTHEWQHPFGVVQISGLDIIGFEEKPIARTHINAGVYALDPSAIDLLTPGKSCDMPALFEMIQSQGHRTIAYPMHEPWLDVGRPDDLVIARNLLSSSPEAL